MSKMIGKLLAGAALSLSLGYGATQAFASPTASEGQYCTTQQERAECAYNCSLEGRVGYCDPELGCRCE